MKNIYTQINGMKVRVDIPKIFSVHKVHIFLRVLWKIRESIQFSILILNL